MFVIIGILQVDTSDKWVQQWVVYTLEDSFKI